MIRFFRHIRKQIMEQNKTKTYLLYAIGEILLVVIGILIALQVNNWNEERKTQAREVALKENLDNTLKSVRTEAEYFRDQLEGNIRLLEYVIRNWDNLSPENINEQALPFVKNNFSPIFFLTAYSQFFDPNMDIYNTAVSDGSISIIRDRDYLRSLHFINNYTSPRINELIEEEYEQSQTINNHIAMLYPEIFLNNSLADSAAAKSHLWSDQTYQEFFREIAKDGTLKYYLAHRLELKKGRLILLRVLEQSIERALSEE